VRKREKFRSAVLDHASDLEHQLERMNTKITYLERYPENFMDFTHSASLKESARHLPGRSTLELAEQSEKFIKRTRENARHLHEAYLASRGLRCQVSLTVPFALNEPSPIGSLIAASASDLEDDFQFLITNGTRTREFHVIPVDLVRVRRTYADIREATLALRDNPDETTYLLPSTALPKEGFSIQVLKKKWLADLDDR
ncbi:hypothetical protein B0A49_13925, partial [Cryomyces minteri]